MESIKNLYEARKKKGYTQNELANLMNLSEKYIGQIERGQRVPKLYVLIKLCDILEVSLDYLVGRESFEESQLKEMVKRFSLKDKENMNALLSKLVTIKFEEE